MKLPRKIPIDMREVCRTGRFDCLRIGQTKELILHNFPHPDDWGGNRSQIASAMTSPSWRYGNIELHFDGPRLLRIFSDYLDTLHGGESLAVDPWFLHEPEKLTLVEVMRALNRERIDFTKRTGVIAEVTLVLTSGVALQFNERDPDTRSVEEAEARIEDPNELRLAAFSVGE